MISNINHPSVKEYIFNLSEHIEVNLKLKGYFNFNSEKKKLLSYAALRMIRNRVQLVDKEQTNVLLSAMLHNCESFERFELCDILKDIINNIELYYFDEVEKEQPKVIRRKRRTPKSE